MTGSEFASGLARQMAWAVGAVIAAALAVGIVVGYLVARVGYRRGLPTEASPNPSLPGSSARRRGGTS
jgi:hypothetical protein